MKTFMKLIVIVAFASIYVSQTSAVPDKIVCYFGSLAVYRTGNGKFTVEDIDPKKCTHLIYSFLGINADGTVRILDIFNDVIFNAFRRFNDLKLKNPNLKTLIAIGGSNEPSFVISRVMASGSLRSNLITSAINFMNAHGFDGFDFHWMYLAQRGGNPADKANFAKLLKEFRERVDATGKKYLLTAAVAATANAVDISYDVPALSKYLDFINVMAYDMHSFYDDKTGQNAPLYASSIDQTPNAKQLNVQASVQTWIDRGASPEKIVLGLGVYGKSFTLRSKSNHALGASVSYAGYAGPYTLNPGMLGYNEICEMQKDGTWTIVWDDEQKVPYTYKNNQWVGYDDVKSIQIKVEFAKYMSLGGLMIWSIETDDFRGICGPKYPILSAINDALSGPK